MKIGLVIAFEDGDMCYLIKKIENTTLKLCLFAAIIVLMTASLSLAQSDVFGAVDRLYIDSVETGPGNDIIVHFNIENDEPLSSVSVPISYDPNLVSLKSINFSGSRVDYVANKIISPRTIEDINGHFLVSYFVMHEDALKAGNGLFFSAVFNLSPTAKNGIGVVIDSLFYPPAGELIFVEATNSTIIKPVFESGFVLAGAENVPPQIGVVSSQTVFEGDSLVVHITASDANNDSLVFALPTKPSGSSFTDNHDGTATFIWAPDYIGPYSSDNSPFNLDIWVGDGSSNSTTSMKIDVINRNRKPIISPIAAIEKYSGELIQFELNASDPDFEKISMTALNLPAHATITGDDPIMFNWPTSISDSGLSEIIFIATDPQGYADSARAVINLIASTNYALIIDTAKAFPGEYVTVGIKLNNLFPIGSFDLLLTYDPSVMNVNNISAAGSRSEQFDLFDYTVDADNIKGRIRLAGTVDEDGLVLLPAGDGYIAYIDFYLYPNIYFGGISAPVRFAHDNLINNQNSLTDTVGQIIEPTAIDFSDGYVRVLEFGEIKIGDINLNGIAYDIGDAIYFSNYFMDPTNFPLNPLQMANSDINRDNVAATIADLVRLIYLIINGSNSNSKPLGIDNSVVKVTPVINDAGLELRYSSKVEIGGILLSLSKDNDLNIDNIKSLNESMTMDITETDSEIKILIYSIEGHRLPSGNISFLNIDNIFKQNINSIDMASFDGAVLTVETQAKGAVLPDRFSLYQNYPNPFNPETVIAFDLPANSHVKLLIYNLIGEKVKTIIDKNLSAGNHAVVWDSHNDYGAAVASGIYFYRLETSTDQKTKKMVLLK